MERQEILQELAKWQEQDKDNRAILVIASERVEKEGRYVSSQGLAGMPTNIIQMLKNAMKNDKGFMAFMKGAVSELALEAVLSKLSDNGNEKSEEE